MNGLCLKEDRKVSQRREILCTLCKAQSEASTGSDSQQVLSRWLIMEKWLLCLLGEKSPEFSAEAGDSMRVAMVQCKYAFGGQMQGLFSPTCPTP